MPFFPSFTHLIQLLQLAIRILIFISLNNKIMNPYTQTGSILVVIALVMYSVGIINEQRTKIVSNKVLFFLSLGICFDITATACMIVGSSSGPLTLHGFIGYSSLLGMIIDSALLWRLKLRNGTNAEVPRQLHLYSRYAYMWWVIAFITGGLLVALR